MATKFRKIFVNLYGENLLSQELEIFDFYEKGFINDVTMRLFLVQYGKKDLTLNNLLP